VLKAIAATLRDTFVSVHALGYLCGMRSTSFVNVIVSLSLVPCVVGCDERRSAIRRDAGLASADTGSIADTSFGSPDVPFPMDAPFAIDAPFTVDARRSDDSGPVVDARLASDAFAPRDAYAPRDAFVGRDAFAGRDAFSPWDAFSPGGGTTVLFPATGDPRVASVMLYFWRLGDYVQATHTTSLPSIREVTTNLVLSENSLTCDTQDVRLLVNSVEVGRFSITSTDTTIARTFTFAPITGPTYTFRYETTRDVGGGCGSSGYADDVSSVTIR
jgi:hypothetical protein